jgi:hypothetical protein
MEPRKDIDRLPLQNDGSPAQTDDARPVEPVVIGRVETLTRGGDVSAWDMEGFRTVAN